MVLRLLLLLVGSALIVAADVVVLKDGSSYTGQLGIGTRARPETIEFSGNNGVGFTFPIRDVQSLIFTANVDTIALRNGKTYTGRYGGKSALHLMGAEGIAYDFPLQDISSIVFSDVHRSGAASTTAAPATAAARVIPEGTEISILTAERIDSENARGGELYSATITSEVTDSRGGIAIPANTRAKLVVREIDTGGAIHTPELVVDLYSVDVDGTNYRTITSNVVEKGRESVGANKRTAIYAGTGAGLGALLGGIFGGGQGAGIGAAAGIGGGALTQLFTRGKRVTVPAETTLIFRLERTLVLKR